VFTIVDGAPVAVAPDGLRLAPGTTCVGDGAVRYREVLEALGAKVPPRESELHLPRARFHAELARDFVDPETVEPLYLRLPDAEQAR
jgi:tRNA threonylcarbamoyladenosine biosynthesis protein TsaB